MHEIEVACAIVEKKRKLLIAKRKPDSFLGGYWEFPGGKREAEESFEECLVRELMEELGIVIRVRQFICNERYVYPQKIIHLHFYICDWISGEAVCHECDEFQWVDPKDLRNFTFPEGDEKLIDDLIANQTTYFG